MSVLVSTRTALAPIESPLLVASATHVGVLGELDEAARQFLALPDGCALHRVAACLHRVAAAILECEDAGVTRHELVPRLAGLRALHARSPFVHRLQAWPRGYAGDFETVEWLCDAANRAEPGTVAWGIEQVALQSPVAQQHRNKVRVQADAVRHAIDTRRPVRVASIGCGGCRDLRLIVADVLASTATLTLVDGDADALDFARAHLALIADRCTFVQGRVPRVLPRLRDHGPYDLVVAGGLFDYLPDRWAVETLRQVRDLLADRGRVLFSNMARGNPYRAWIEYLAEWFLIERSEPELHALLEQSGFDPARAVVERDATGLAAIVTATR